MGLDMYAYSITADQLITPDAQVDLEFVKDSGNEIHYWRKHHDLHGWMHHLYVAKGGTDPEFNCNSVRLTPEDLDVLEQTIKDSTLPNTTGFFFGNNPPDSDSIEDDLEFISNARDAITSGLIVYYTSWW